MDAAAVELVTKDRWTVGLMVAGLQLLVLVMAGYVWLAARAYRRGDKAIGVILTVLFLLAGGGWSVGVPLALALGWASARRWQVGWFMAAWTLVILLAAADIALAAVMKGMSLDEWRAAFGWLPDLGPGRR
ncbi:MAG: hypothetical protein K2X87_05910 [Gemmataceae bacterium]|nr:hypothetical protein [Gemmataceae bacterium]